MTPYIYEIREYVDSRGCSDFADWFHALDSQAATKVTIALYRLEQGNDSNVKHLGDGVLEYKIHFGPGYRIYFGKEGKQLIILLGGGTKDRQDRDICDAKQRWKEYKQTKQR